MLLIISESVFFPFTV